MLSQILNNPEFHKLKQLFSELPAFAECKHINNTTHSCEARHLKHAKCTCGNQEKWDELLQCLGHTIKS